jgi:hypothetical protein
MSGAIPPLPNTSLWRGAQLKHINFYFLPLYVVSSITITYTRAVWKVRGFTLLLRVGTLWRCGDGLFFEVPPLASVALLTTLHSFLKNVPLTVDHLEISCLGAPFSFLEKPRNLMG